MKKITTKILIILIMGLLMTGCGKLTPVEGPGDPPPPPPPNDNYMVLETVYDGSGNIKDTSEKLFQTNGNIPLLYVHKDENGNTTKSTSFFYDESGKYLGQRSVTSVGNLIYEINYIYNENGEWIRYSELDETGTIVVDRVLERDENNRITQERGYAVNVPRYTYNYVYEANGNHTILKYDDPNIYIGKTYVIVDNGFNQEERIEYDENNIKVSKEVIERAPNGYCTRKAYYDENDNLLREYITEYDENYNDLSDTRLNGSGNIVWRIERSFDADGKLLSWTKYDNTGAITEVGIYELIN